MKVTSKFKTVGIAFALGAFTVACNQETVNDTNSEIDEAQTEMTHENMDAKNEINEFEAWVETNANKAETASEEEWLETRREYKRREAELDAKSSTWDEETRQGWENVKEDWNKAENKVQERLGDIKDIDVDVDVTKEKN